ncbi:uncharacterized protein LOC111716666 [Eurytemora carolleeae]|uniref:uncharacterized protein LOC111716666 n=1 Tax=Eurytemora carolleeae TaxID=1294199 RepID=UPI000C7943CC|nr:uncharacterized protein LOC111716666 [Eurytemora carolleeae]|eukprot:XP_023347917.1 uncharacterized protein LOC111716666 [Eurytemora affinis]
MSCGSTISQNNTYHVISNFNTVTDPSPCTYTVCPMNNNICKIRLDFETFTISGPATTTLNTADVIIGPSIGDCTTDSFTVTAPGSRSPPTICGLNTGQHMYLDSSSACNILSFNIDRATTVTRSWRVKVTQYDCGSDVPGIVEDCLQYFTGLSGTIRNFNYDTTKVDSALATANTHLSNQNYNICFRQERGFCSICFSPVITNSFSVSASGNDAEAQSAISSLCTGSGAYGDYIEVINIFGDYILR